MPRAAIDPSAPEAGAFARAFRLTDVPDDFVDDPYRYYRALREHDPVHELGHGSFLLTRYEDVAAVYRDPRASSDKKQEFKPSTATRRSTSITRPVSSSTTRRSTRACAG
jgi:cytochrome P450